MLNRKPRKGDRLHYNPEGKTIIKSGPVVGIVDRCEGGICHYNGVDGYDSGLFIWQFKPGELNKCFTISSKGTTHEVRF